MNPYQSHGGGLGGRGGMNGAPQPGAFAGPGPHAQPGSSYVAMPAGQPVMPAVAGVSVSPAIATVAADVLVQYGAEVSEFARNLAKIDAYVTTGVCKDILQKKFPGLSNSVLLAGATFQNLMMYYKVHHQVETVPADVTVVLSTMAEALAAIDLENRTKLQEQEKAAQAAAVMAKAQAQMTAQAQMVAQAQMAPEPYQAPRGRGRPRGRPRGRGRGRTERAQVPLYGTEDSLTTYMGHPANPYVGMEADKVGILPNPAVASTAMDRDARGTYGGTGGDGEPEDDKEQMYLESVRKRPRKRATKDSTSDPGADEYPILQSVSGESIVRVLCNGKEGFYRLEKRTMDCTCEVCGEIKKIMDVEELDMSPREFEYHAGMSHCKRWRSTIFLYNPAFKGSRGKTLGNWLDLHGNEEVPFTAKVRGVHDYLVRTYAIPAGRGWGCNHADQNWEGLMLEKEYHERRQMRVERNGGQVASNVPMHGYSHTPDFPKSHVQPDHLYAVHDLGAHGDRAGPSAAVGGRGKRRPGRPVNPELLAEKRQAVAEAAGSLEKPLITKYEVIEDTMGLSVKVSYGRAVYSGVLDLVRVRKTMSKGSADPVAALKAENMGGAASPTTGTATTSGIVTPREASVSPIPGDFGGHVPGANDRDPAAAPPGDVESMAPMDHAEFGMGRINNVDTHLQDAPVPSEAQHITDEDAPAPSPSRLAPEPPTIVPEQQPNRKAYVPPGSTSTKKKQWGKTPEEKEAEFNKMSADGPQPSDTCGFCGTQWINSYLTSNRLVFPPLECRERLTRHASSSRLLPGLPGEDKINPTEMGFLGRADHGLGELTLIKVNKGNHAWVHDQCARWAPETHDPNGEGVLAGIGTACLRGRRIRCKRCDKKGATMGCFSKNCKHSWHLPCARLDCIINKDPYFVCCQQHRHEFGL